MKGTLKNLFNSFGLLVSDNENKISLYDKNNKMRKYIFIVNNMKLIT